MRKLIFSAGTAFTFLCSTHAAELLRFSFGSAGSETTVETSPAFAPTISAGNLTATPITDPNNTVAMEISSAATTPAGAPFLRLDPQGSSTTPDAAVTGNKYFEFTVTPEAGYQFTIDSIGFDAARGGGSTPRGFLLRSSADNFTADLAGQALTTSRPTYTPFSVNLSATHADLTGPVTFRFYNYAPAAGNSIDYDNIVLNGTVALVPEPSTLALAALGAAAFLCRRNRRN